MHVWSILRPHGAALDTFAGIPQPLRYEVLRMECDRHAQPEELLWRLSKIDGLFLEEQMKQREKLDKKKKVTKK